MFSNTSFDNTTNASVFLFPDVDWHTELLQFFFVFSKVFFLLSQPARSIQSTLNPEPLSQLADKVWFDRCPADIYIQPLAPQQSQHKEIASLPTFLWFRSPVCSSLKQRSLSDLKGHAAEDNRHLFQRSTFSLSCLALSPRGVLAVLSR